jgi:hypothetical protein
MERLERERLERERLAEERSKRVAAMAAEEARQKQRRLEERWRSFEP